MAKLHTANEFKSTRTAAASRRYFGGCRRCEFVLFDLTETFSYSDSGAAHSAFRLHSAKPRWLEMLCLKRNQHDADGDYTSCKNSLFRLFFLEDKPSDQNRKYYTGLA